MVNFLAPEHIPDNAKGGWFVYLLRCADNTLYCGITRDPARRLDEHNGLFPGGARYTKGRRPVQMLGALPASDRASASRLERAIKKLPRHAKLAYFGHSA